ncbi:MAG: tyrosine-protein phosphatase [Oscillospiraceae bacterium]|nr:tyrosine-protein phosphatase [Oscillospiraceae bacterium]
MSGLLRSTLNTRTFDKYISSDGTRLSDRILRSDVPEQLSPDDRALLLEKHITTIIDMRTSEEVQRHKNALSDDDEFVYLWYPIVEGSKPSATLDGVPYSYMKIAESENISNVFKAIADADSGVMFNCTAGKDRTGVVSAVLLLLCGVPGDAIIDDYVISRDNNRERLERYLSEHPEVDREIVMANEKSMARFIDLFTEKYGSARKYLTEAGLSAAQTENIRLKMLMRRSDHE